MEEVWKARDTRLGRIVTIKQVKEKHSERFKQEARSIAALNHPCLCQPHDIGPGYLVLEYVGGDPQSQLSLQLAQQARLLFVVPAKLAVEREKILGLSAAFRQIAQIDE